MICSAMETDLSPEQTAFGCQRYTSMAPDDNSNTGSLARALRCVITGNRSGGAELTVRPALLLCVFTPTLTAHLSPHHPEHAREEHGGHRERGDERRKVVPHRLMPSVLALSDLVTQVDWASHGPLHLNCLAWAHGVHVGPAFRAGRLPDIRSMRPHRTPSAGVAAASIRCGEFPASLWRGRRLTDGGRSPVRKAREGHLTTNTHVSLE